MTNKFALTIVIGAVLVSAAGYVGLHSLFNRRPTQPVAQQSSQASGMIVPVVVTTTPTASTSQSGKPTDTIQVASVDEAYQNLYAQLQAQKVPLELVNASNTKFSAVYKLYEADVASAKKGFPKAGTYSLHMASIDLNDDGIAEILVYEDLPGFCGTGGCPFDVYQKRGANWQPLFSILSSGVPGLANVYTGGYRDLYITVQVNGYISNVLRYSWSGSAYEPQGTVATWDGTQFSNPQQ